MNGDFDYFHPLTFFQPHLSDEVIENLLSCIDHRLDLLQSAAGSSDPRRSMSLAYDDAECL